MDKQTLLAGFKTRLSIFLTPADESTLRLALKVIGALSG
jgi:hypothetical protein